MTDSPIAGLIGLTFAVGALSILNRQLKSVKGYRCYACGRKATHLGMAHDVFGNPKTVPVCDDYPNCSYKSGKLF